MVRDERAQVVGRECVGTRAGLGCGGLTVIAGSTGAGLDTYVLERVLRSGGVTEWPIAGNPSRVSEVGATATTDVPREQDGQDPHRQPGQVVVVGWLRDAMDLMVARDLVAQGVWVVALMVTADREATVGRMREWENAVGVTGLVDAAIARMSVVLAEPAWTSGLRDAAVAVR